MPDLDESRQQAEDAAQQVQGRVEDGVQQVQDGAEDDVAAAQEDSGDGPADKSFKDRASDLADQVKDKMDRTGDGKLGVDDLKKAGEDAVNKVKGMFKKD